jgi:hypothetical protein
MYVCMYVKLDLCQLDLCELDLLACEHQSVYSVGRCIRIPGCVYDGFSVSSRIPYEWFDLRWPAHTGLLSLQAASLEAK